MWDTPKVVCTTPLKVCSQAKKCAQVCTGCAVCSPADGRYSLKTDDYPKFLLFDRTGDSTTTVLLNQLFWLVFEELSTWRSLPALYSQIQDVEKFARSNSSEYDAYPEANGGKDFSWTSLPISVAWQLSPPSGKGLLIVASRALRSRMSRPSSRLWIQRKTRTTSPSSRASLGTGAKIGPGAREGRAAPVGHDGCDDDAMTKLMRKGWVGGLEMQLMLVLVSPNFQKINIISIYVYDNPGITFPNLDILQIYPLNKDISVIYHRYIHWIPWIKFFSGFFLDICHISLRYFLKREKHWKSLKSFPGVVAASHGVPFLSDAGDWNLVWKLCQQFSIHCLHEIDRVDNDLTSIKWI